jgi:hypothetical protein
MIRNITKLVLVLCSVIVSISVIPCTTHAIDRKFWGRVWVDWVGVPWTNDNQKDNILHTVRTATNRVLWMLSFAALMLCLYAGFRMMTSGWDSKQYSAWLSILKNAWIWLAIIALSWLIVSLIFYVINWSVQINE